jgi:anhydro-N-acetylmuramic acid kinase
MGKIYTALGLMSGTSGDGIDASIIQTDGETHCKVLENKFFKYSSQISSEIHKSKVEFLNQTNILNFSKDWKKPSKNLHLFEQKITSLHADASNNLIKRFNLDLIGFHGQTIYHDPKNKFSFQLGLGDMLSKLTKKTVVYNFRENDLKNNGEGAPLAPIFHKLLVKQNKINLPVTILNIGGIANITSINENYEMASQDIGPGNCLIDTWIRLKYNKRYDDKGLIARSGGFGELNIDLILESYFNSPLSKKKSFDTNDFVDFINNIPTEVDLSIEDFACTLTEITAEIISKKIKYKNIYVCGGGRKNLYLIERIENKIQHKINLIDELSVNGDFIESQAFAYLAVRSYLGLPISFPETTGCKEPSSGGVIVKNF